MHPLIIILLTIIAPGLIAALYWYAFRFEPANFMLDSLNINLSSVNISSGKEKQSAGLELFTILHLSDFHLRNDAKGKKLIAFMSRLKKIKTDFIFITGDLVEKNENFALLEKMLEGFDASIAKYAVLGVHDYYNKSPREFLKNMVKRKKTYKRQNDVEGFIEGLGRLGFRVLRNESDIKQIKRGNLSFDVQVAGIEDSIIQKADAALALKKLKGKEEIPRCDIKDVLKLSGSKIHVLNNPKKITVCLTHTPDRHLFLKLAAYGADLVFCGHTHGGQVRLPGIGAIISGCNLKSKHASGLFYFKRFVLYISRGLGEGRYSPFRFYCQPQASLIKVSIAG